MTPSYGRSVLALAVLILSLLPRSESFAQEAGEPVVIGERFEIESEILEETRPIIVGKPQSYESGQDSFAVLYVLDGAGHFHHTTAITKFLAANDRIPEMLVVGVPNFTIGINYGPQ